MRAANNAPDVGKSLVDPSIIGQHIANCYQKAGCKAPPVQASSYECAQALKQVFPGKQIEACIIDKLKKNFSIEVTDEHLTVFGEIVSKVRAISSVPIQTLTVIAQGLVNEIPYLQKVNKSVNVLCDTDSKRQAVIACIKDEYAATVQPFGTFCANTHNCLTGLGQCIQLYGPLQNVTCQCEIESMMAHKDQIGPILMNSTQCTSQPLYYAVENLKSLETCEARFISACKNATGWWLYG